jgi:hypothetical protein
MRDVTIGTARGRVLLSIYDATYSPTTLASGANTTRQPAPPGHVRITRSVETPAAVLAATDNEGAPGRLGFRFNSFTPWSSPYTITTAAAPLWPLIIAFAAWPLARASRTIRRAHRRRAGLCIGCAYDLRGSPDRRCPECGRIDTSPGPQRVSALPPCAILALVIVGALRFELTNPVIRTSQAPPAQSTSGGARSPEATTNHSANGAPQVVASSQPGPSRASRPGITPPRGPWMPPHAREITARLDRDRTFVFLWMAPGVEKPQHGLVRVQIFARASNRWAEEIVYVRAGDTIRGSRLSTPLRVGEIKSPPQGDLTVTFLNPAGELVETRTAAADYNDPVRHLLGLMPTHMGAQLEDELFPPR